LANQLVDSLSVYPTIYKVLDIPGGAEMCAFFLPNRSKETNTNPSLVGNQYLDPAWYHLRRLGFQKCFFGDQICNLEECELRINGSST